MQFVRPGTISALYLPIFVVTELTSRSGFFVLDVVAARVSMAFQKLQASLSLAMILT